MDIYIVFRYYLFIYFFPLPFHFSICIYYSFFFSFVCSFRSASGHNYPKVRNRMHRMIRIVYCIWTENRLLRANRYVFISIYLLIHLARASVLPTGWNSEWIASATREYALDYYHLCGFLSSKMNGMHAQFDRKLKLFIIQFGSESEWVRKGARARKRLRLPMIWMVVSVLEDEGDRHTQRAELIKSAKYLSRNFYFLICSSLARERALLYVISLIYFFFLCIFASRFWSLVNSQLAFVRIQIT